MQIKQSSLVKLHQTTLAFYSIQSPLQQRFEVVYGHLPRPTNSLVDIHITWQQVNQPMAPQPPKNTPPLIQDELVSYYGTTDNIIWIRMPKYGLLKVDLPNQCIEGQVTQNCLDVYGAFEDVMMISLAPLYRRQGWFPLHAFATVSPTGQTALITGEMGAGKTTTGLALLNAGWKLLSNDSPLLTTRNDKVYVLAYPGQLSAFVDSLLRFESLQRFIKTKAKAEAEVKTKRVFRAEEAFNNPWATEEVAGGVFFPQVVAGLQQSELVDVSPAKALLQLIPQAIEGWDKAVISQNLQLLRQLVEQVSCYTLRLSPHVEHLPGVIQGGMLSVNQPEFEA